MSDWQIYLVVGVFSAVILVIAFDLIDMAVAALVGASVLIALGIIDEQDLIATAQHRGGTDQPAVRRHGRRANPVRPRVFSISSATTTCGRRRAAASASCFS